MNTDTGYGMRDFFGRKLQAMLLRLVPRLRDTAAPRRRGGNQSLLTSAPTTLQYWGVQNVGYQGP